MSKKSASKTSFVRLYEPTIIRGGKVELGGWWLAADECVAKFKGKAAPYAKAALEDGSSFSESTIAQYVGAVLRARRTVNADTGVPFVEADFVGIDQLLKTLRGSGQREGGKAPVKRSERKLSDVVVDDAKGRTKAEIRAAIAALELLLVK